MKTKHFTKSTAELLLDLAKKARKNAHAPYSKFKVGAALVTKDGNLAVGCNVENSSYGGTVCAERGAVQAAVATFGSKNLRLAEIVVVTDQTPPWPPCGFCRQVLAEFVDHPENLKVHLASPTAIQETFTLADLLPHAFSGKNLKK